MSESTYYLDPALYDVVYSDIVADIEPHLALLRGARGSVLEVCCGNGFLQDLTQADQLRPGPPRARGRHRPVDRVEGLSA